MSREIDRRDFSVNRIAVARKAELALVAHDVHRLRIAGFDPFTGNPSRVISTHVPTHKTNYFQRAAEHLREISQVLGLAPSQPVEFVGDPSVQQSSAGSRIVHFKQNYKGIPIFHAALAVHFTPDGAIKDVVGSAFTVEQESNLSAKLSVKQALLKAAEYIATPHLDEIGATDQFGQPLGSSTVDLTGFAPEVIAIFPDRADFPTILKSGPFGDEIRGNLLFFPLSDGLRLSWEFTILMPNDEGQYRTIVDANSGEILFCHQLMKMVAARANIYRVDGGGTREQTDFPRPLDDYALPIPANLPAGFPDTWVAGDSTIGNATNAHQGVSGPAFQGAQQNGLLVFDPASTSGIDQQVLNIFYYCCYMHDYFYLLGFREVDGNFQENNFGRDGAQNDRVDARAHPGAVEGTANMFTPIDGSSPTMNMGLVTRTGRHTAFDSTVVYHEFVHGVTNRLVGGRLNSNALDDPQSGGMGEGWGDYIACTINKVNVIGNWVVDMQGGIRNFAYDSNYPHHYGNVGAFVNGIDYSEVHNIGEIWCATLMEVNKNIGPTLAVQLVIDALKLSPSNPSFLDMRDSILGSLEDLLKINALSAQAFISARKGVWKAFAKFGMGSRATSNGAQLGGIVSDFTEPVELEVVAFQAPNSNLWTSDEGDTQLGMMASTIPNVAKLQGGGYVVAFQANTGNLWVTYGDPPTGTDTQLGMMPGTSPSVAALSGGKYVVAFQANTGNLWTTDGSPQSGVDTDLGMAAGTSPSIAAIRSGRLRIAFQANTGNLWTSDGRVQSGFDTQLGMMVGTSPSIAMRPNGEYVIAFQANTGNLWHLTVDGRNRAGVDTQLGMMPGTSPSIAVLPNGRLVIAFQANTGNLWIADGTRGVDTELGMMAGTSPCAAQLLGNGHFAFQASNSLLWTTAGAPQIGNDSQLPMALGTSPTITQADLRLTEGPPDI